MSRFLTKAYERQALDHERINRSLQEGQRRERREGRPTGDGTRHYPTPDIGHGWAQTTYITANGAHTVNQGLDSNGRPIDSSQPAKKKTA